MNEFVETWKGIAFALGRSERWCRYMARREQDPLPVFKVGGIVRLNQSDLDEWLGRERDRSMSRSAPPKPAQVAPASEEPAASASSSHLQLIA